MTTEEIKQEEDMMKEWEKTHRRGRIMGGLLVITAGSLFLAREMGEAIPQWVFSWKMLLIAIGLHVAVKHRFRKFFWLPFVLVGSIFLITQDLAPQLAMSKYLWPAAIILIGLAIIFKPRNKCNPHHYHRWKRHQWKHRNWNDHTEKHWEQKRFQYSEEAGTPEDYINADIVFSGVKKNIISKDFKGGKINVVFGGAEINLSQSDIQGKAEIEISQVFAGIKLIVPANWKIKSELETIMAGLEDKRNVQNDVVGESDKILVLKGSIVFGGIEIKSY
jgi:hypothetical protein